MVLFTEYLPDAGHWANAFPEAQLTYLTPYKAGTSIISFRMQAADAEEVKSPAPGYIACDTGSQEHNMPHSRPVPKPNTVLPLWGVRVMFRGTGTMGTRRPPSTAHSLRKA